MWLFSRTGFFSVVAHRDESDKVLVRAPIGRDLESLRRRIGEGEITQDPSGDYSFRMVLARDRWARFAEAEARSLDYDDFKTHVERVFGTARQDVYEGSGACCASWTTRTATTSSTAWPANRSQGCRRPRMTGG
jgi:hypothetical protein